MKPLPKRVWILGWISLFADVASEMVYPIIPVFMQRVLLAPALALGAVEGFAEAIVSFMKGWSGWHSDRTGKRAPFIQLGYGLSALGRPIIGFAHSIGAVLLGRGLDRFGKGLRTTSRDALLADSVEKEDYGRAFGLHRSMDTFGAFLGGVVLLVLLALLVRAYSDLRMVFLIAIIPGAISVLFTFLLKDVPREAEPPHLTSPLEGRGMRQRLGLSEMPPGYWRAVLVTLLFGLGNTSDTFLLLRSNAVFEKTSATSIGFFAGTTVIEGALIMTVLSYLLYNVFYVALSYPAGKLSDRIGRWPIIAAGFLVYSGVYLGFAFANTALIWFLWALYGVYNGLTDGVGKALVADHAPRNARGTALGFYYMAGGFMTLIGNLIFGLVWDRVNPQAAFLFSAVVAGLAVVLIPLTRGMERG